MVQLHCALAPTSLPRMRGSGMLVRKRPVSRHLHSCRRLSVFRFLALRLAAKSTRAETSGPIELSTLWSPI